MTHDAISVLQDGAAGEPRIRDPSEAAVAVEGVARQVEGLECLERGFISQIPTGKHLEDWIGLGGEFPGKGNNRLTMTLRI